MTSWTPSDTDAGRWDEAQRRVVSLPAARSGVVLGAPGTGKTTALIGRVAHLVESGTQASEILVLTPTRQTATALRDRLAAVVGRATRGPMARSVASFAYQVVRARSLAQGAPAPQLLTAGEQDAVIADLLDGDAEDAQAGVDRWPAALPAAVRATRAFRGELRAMFAECNERGILPGELEDVADRAGSQVWRAAAGFFAEYRYAFGQMRGAHRDSAEFLREAAVALRGGDDASSGPASALRVLMVDDAQELTPAGIDLVASMRERGVAVLAFGDPDISAGAFRGATPQSFARLCDVLGREGGALHVLDAPHRASAALTRLTRTITQAIGAAGRVEHRRPPGPAVPHGDVRTFHAPSPLEEVDRIARVLREWHVLEQVPWAGMAVIAHDTRQVADLEIELAAREVPIRAAGLQRPLGREQVVRDLAGIVRLGMTDPGERSAEDLTAALTSPFGGLDAVGIRRLRARLRSVELADEGSRAAPELLVEAMAAPLDLAMLDTREARAAERLAHTLTMIAQQVAEGTTVHELLWLVWDRSRDASGRRLADVWRVLADGEGSTSAETARALDALVALFDAAKRFVERAAEEGTTAAATTRFLRRILDSDVPEDTLSAIERTQAVTVLTPASALGSEFDSVVIAGVQDGVWPNVRLRGGLLDAGLLAEAVDAHRSGRDPALSPAPLDRRRDALHDELRLFARAVSRARTRLLVTAVDDDDLGPSPLFAMLPEPDAIGEAQTEHPLTLRGLVAQHRRALTTSASAVDRARAAGQLVVLADEGVPGADPSQWYGLLAPSSTAPLRDPDRAPVPVSPSKLTHFAECPLDWAVRALGGDTRSRSAGLGTILHAAMETVPSGDRDRLQQVVDDRWGELDFEAPWIARKEHTWATMLVGRLHEYLVRFHREGGRTVGAETGFRLAIDLDREAGTPPRVIVVDDDERPTGRTALLSGFIDRVEAYPRGKGEQVRALADDEGTESVVVVDLKTGRSEARVSDAKVADDPQLAAYQLAMLEGVIPSARSVDNAGARLVVLSKTIKAQPHYRLATQDPMTPEARSDFLERVVEAARGMAADRFDAPIDTHCATARFGVCGIHTVKAVSAT